MVGTVTSISKVCNKVPLSSLIVPDCFPSSKGLQLNLHWFFVHILVFSKLQFSISNTKLSGKFVPVTVKVLCSYRYALTGEKLVINGSVSEPAST